MQAATNIDALLCCSIVALERQVNFKIPQEDEHLLESAAREHGSIKAGIIAGLRLLEQQRLDRVPEPPAEPQPESPARPSPAADPAKPPAPPAPRTEPAPAPDGSWWSSEDLASFLGVKRSTIHRWQSQDRVQLRGAGLHEQADLASLRLDRSRAADLCGVKSATLGRWAEDGRAKADQDGLFVLGELTVPLDRARAYGLTPAQCERLSEREPGRARLLDVIDLVLEEN